MRAFKFGLILAALFFSGDQAIADDRTLDVTIKVVESPADLPSAVTKTIKLPPAAAQKAREQSSSTGPGSGTASGQSNNQNIVGENAPKKGKDKDKEKKKKGKNKDD
jgi:hypothetical protein